MHTDALIVPTRVEASRSLGAKCTLRLRFARHHFLASFCTSLPLSFAYASEKTFKSSYKGVHNRVSSRVCANFKRPMGTSVSSGNVHTNTRACSSVSELCFKIFQGNRKNQEPKTERNERFIQPLAPSVPPRFLR